MLKTLSAISFLLFLSITINPSSAHAKEVKITNPDLIRAINQFNISEYRAARTNLLKAKESGADSAVTDYYLGLTYKELLVFDKAISFLNDSATDTSGVEEAFTSLAEIYFHMDMPAKALSEIEKAEKADANPAYTAYLKGLILMSQKDFNKAIKAFESAKHKDPSLAYAAEYQINIASRQ